MWRASIRALALFLLSSSSLAAAAESGGARVGPEAPASVLRSMRGAEPGAELRLVFDLRRGSDAPIPLTVWLGADYIDIVESARETLYDYRLRRRLVLDRARGSFASFSLYGDVAFRQYDMENRFALLRRLAESGHADLVPLALKPFWIESDSGLAIPGIKRPVIAKETLADGAIRFRVDGEEEALFAPQGLPQPPFIARLFARFLRYRLPLHPDIVTAIAADGRMPQRLVFVTATGDDRHPAALILQHSETVEGADYPLPPSLEPRLPPSDGSADANMMQAVLPSMRAALAGTQGGGPRSLADYRSAVEKALKQNAKLSAALLLAEMTMQYGRSALDCRIGPPDVPCRSGQELNKILAADPRAVALVEAQTIEAKDPARAVAAWQSLKREKVPQGYVLDAFLASRLSLAGKRAEAAAAFESAFRGNPYLPGLYRDLGDHFLRGLRADLAWLCYDLGRLLPSPTNADVLADIDRLEQQVVAQYPDFF